MMSVDHCLICGSRDLERIGAAVAPFLLHRCGIPKEQAQVDRLYCGMCDFSFFSRRLVSREVATLYKDYRGVNYNYDRLVFEPWYRPYIDLFENRDNGFHLNRIVQAQERFLKWGIPFRRILDYGGEEDAWMARGIFVGGEVTGYDLSIACEKPSLESFDLVFCSQVLEHVSFPRTFTSKLRKYLAGNGCIYLDAPVEYSGELRETLVPGHPINTMHEHVNHWSARALSRLLVRCGYLPLRVELADNLVAALARRSARSS